MEYNTLFYLPKEKIYLSNHSTGCLPVQTKKALDQCMEKWAQEGTDAWIGWLKELSKFEVALAQMLDGEPNEFCLQPNVSSAVTKIIGSLPVRKGRNKIVISAEDFPTIGYVAKQAERWGYQIEVLPSNQGHFSVDDWKQKINERVQMILVTHILPRNNFRNPIEDIISYANCFDVFSVVDIAQSVGIVPLNVKRLNAHFVVANCIKWLCGGPVAAFLWANLKTIERFHPIDIGWFSKSDPFEENYQNFEYAKNARRFLGGTPAIIPCLMARHSVETLNAIGVETIYRHNQHLCAPLVEYANKHSIMQSPLLPHERGGTICLKFKDPVSVFIELRKKGFITDSHLIIHPHSTIRISPHIYNETAEIEKLIHCLDTMQNHF